MKDREPNKHDLSGTVATGVPANKNVASPAEGAESKQKNPNDRIDSLNRRLKEQQKAMNNFLKWNSEKGEQE